MNNKLFIDFEHALFVGQLTKIKHHRHTTGAICVALHGNISLQSRTSSYRAPTFYVPQDIAVEIHCDAPLLIYCFELNTQTRKAISITLGIEGNEIRSLSNSEKTLVEPANTLFRKTELCSEDLAEFRKLFTPSDPARDLQDQRVLRIINTLQSAPSHNFTVKELTELASLSKSRLTEIFKAQTGLTLRRYRLWQRLILAADLVSQGYDLTYCAHHSGFSDSAHLSNSSRKLLGLSPIELLSQPSVLKIFIDRNHAIQNCQKALNQR